MSDNLAERVAIIDAGILLPLIERALDVAVRGVSNWHFTPIGGGYAARVWRFKGQADLQTGPAAWSMVPFLLAIPYHPGLGSEPRATSIS
jgi:hypothetical protein